MGIEAIGSVLKKNRKKGGLDEEMHAYRSGGCKVKRKIKENLVESGSL